MSEYKVDKSVDYDGYDFENDDDKIYQTILNKEQIDVYEYEYEYDGNLVFGGNLNIHLYNEFIEKSIEGRLKLQKYVLLESGHSGYCTGSDNNLYGQYLYQITFKDDNKDYTSDYMYKFEYNYNACCCCNISNQSKHFNLGKHSSDFRLVEEHII